MLKYLFAAGALLIAGFAAEAASAQVSVSGYTRADGTYVAPYTRSSPNGTTADNYGSSRSSPYTAPAPLYTPAPAYRAPTTPPPCSGYACYAQSSPTTGQPRTTWVNGYTRRDGTYVAGYYRSGSD